MAGGGTHPPKRKTSLYSDEHLQNTLQAVQSKFSHNQQLKDGLCQQQNRIQYPVQHL